MKELIFPDRQEYELEASSLIITYESIRTGHFKLAGGSHSDTKADCETIIKDPDGLERMGILMARYLIGVLKLNGIAPPDLVSPTPNGAVPLGRVIARIIGNVYGREIPVLGSTKFSDRRLVGFEVTDPQEQIGVISDFKGDELTVLGVEDTATTYGSTRRNIGAQNAAANEYYGKRLRAMGFLAFAERQGSVRDRPGDPPKLSLASIFAREWPQADCADCGNGVPITLGHGDPAPKELVDRVLSGWQ